MRNPLTTLLLGISIVCIVGCQDAWEQHGEPYPIAPPIDNDNRSEQLIGKKWKLTAYTEDGEDILDEIYEACELDNITTYYQDGTYKDHEGATKCDPEDPDTYDEGKWKIEGDKLIQTPEDSPFSLNMTILELTSTTLKLDSPHPFADDIRIVMTFTAQ